MKKLLIIALLLACFALPALAESTLYTTDNVNLREGPGQKYAKIGAVAKGTGVEYLGRISKDDKGVDWYQVRYYGEAVWISSRYAYIDPDAIANSYAGDGYLDYNEEITAIPMATPQPVITAVPSFDNDTVSAPTFGVPGMIELSGFWKTSLKGSAISLGLPGFKQGAPRKMYYNDVLLIAGQDTTDHMLVIGTGYTIFGVYVGMDIKSAQAMLTAAGLVQSNGGMGLVFQHPTGIKTEDGADTFDASISAVTNGSGKVTEISWSAITAL